MAATQPFPTKPPAFERQGISEDDLIDFTPELRAEALEIVKKYKMGPLYTPPVVGTEELHGTIQVPGWGGGANWWGAALDPEAGDPSSERPDLDFLEYAYDLIYRRFPVDAERQALLGYSDGASYGLSVGLSNPRQFRAVMAWAAGFVALDAATIPEDAPKPLVYLEYGTHDELFPFEQVAVPMRQTLESGGYDVSFHVDQGGRHWPSSTFQDEALDWFFSEPWQPRS